MDQFTRRLIVFEIIVSLLFLFGFNSEVNKSPRTPPTLGGNHGRNQGP